MTNKKKWTLVNIIKKYPQNILKRSQQSYFIIKKNEWECDNLIKR